MNAVPDSQFASGSISGSVSDSTSDPSSDPSSDPTSDSASRSADATDETGASVGGRRALLVAAAGVAPWVLVPSDGGTTLVFSFGLVNPNPLTLEPVHRYVLVDTGRLPRSLLAWPTATVLYTMAALSAALALVHREDRRITAGLFALAGVDVLYFGLAFSFARVRVIAIPVGVAVLWLAAWASRPTSWRRF